MTESLHEYLDLCKELTNTKSDRNLARKIGLSHGAVSEWRRGKNMPDENAILALAKRAGLDETEALILLNLWKSEGDAKAIYERLLMSKFVQATKDAKKFGATLGGIAVIFSCEILFSPQNTEIKQVFSTLSDKSTSHNIQSNKHYAIIYRIYQAYHNKVTQIKRRFNSLLLPSQTRRIFGGLACI